MADKRRPRIDPVTVLPVLMLEVTNRCPCRCIMCDLWKPTRQGPEKHLQSNEMDLDLLRGWIPGWQSLAVSRVGLTGGEPLLHTAIEDLLAILGQAGFRLTLMTTGSLIERHLTAITTWCDSVVVSLDGPEEIHDAIRRVPGAFAALSSGVAALRSTTVRSPRIIARCTVQRANLGALADTVTTAQRLDLDGISFLPVDTGTDSFGRSSGPGRGPQLSDLLPSAGDLITLEKEIDAVARLSTTDAGAAFVAENREQLLHRILGHFRAEFGIESHHSRLCNAPWVSAVVGCKGHVSPCFFQPAYGQLDPKAPLARRLNSSSALDFRRTLDVATNPRCRRCVCPLALGQDEDPR